MGSEKWQGSPEYLILHGYSLPNYDFSIESKTWNVNILPKYKKVAFIQQCKGQSSKLLIFTLLKNIYDQIQRKIKSTASQLYDSHKWLCCLSLNKQRVWSPQQHTQANGSFQSNLVLFIILYRHSTDTPLERTQAQRTQPQQTYASFQRSRNA